MKISKLLIVAAATLTSFGAYADKNSKARKALYKGDLPKAEALIRLSLAKDTLNPAACYLYSVLFTVDSFPRYNIDSALHFITEAQADWQALTEKEQGKLLKDDFAPELFHQQREKTDSLGYHRAVSLGHVAAYEQFLTQFEGAAMVDMARTKRDSVAFADAAGEGTWQAYQQFYEKYPAAAQVPEAQAQFKELIFNDLTQDKKLISFKSFLKKFPNTPFRKEAEEQIFEIMTAANAPEAYLQFMKEYPASHLGKKALDFLYSIDQAAYHFSYYPLYTPVRAVQDSLDRLRELEQAFLVPFRENEQYGFLMTGGRVLFPPSFHSIRQEYFCGEIYADFLQVDDKLINRRGKVIAKGQFAVCQGIGAGLIKAGKAEKLGLWHKSGYRILAEKYEDIALLDNRLLKIVQNGKAGLATFSGRLLIAPRYDDIVVDGDFWVFIQGEALAFSTLEKIVAIADQNPLTLKSGYDELERLEGGYLLCYQNDTETLIDKNLGTVIPPAVQNIFPMYGNWLLKQPFGYRIYQADSRQYAGALYSQVLFNSQWQALKGDSGWTLTHQKGTHKPLAGLDSVRLINDNIVLAFKELERIALFSGGASVAFSPSDKVYALGENFGRQEHKSEEHFLVIDAPGTKKVLDMQGTLLFETRASLRYLSPQHLIVETKGKAGIIGTNGKLALPEKYDEIGQTDIKGLAPVFLNGNFGSYHLPSGLLVPPRYDTRIRYFNDWLLMATSDGKAGLISYQGKPILPFQYEEIQPWADSLVMAKKDGLWAIISVTDRAAHYVPFISFQSVRDDAQEKIIKIYTGNGYGIVSNHKGIVLAPTYNDLVNLGSETEPLYFAEKHVPEAEFYVVVYADSSGNPIKSLAFKASEYDKIFCQ